MRIRPTIKSARSTLHLLPQFSTTADKTTINPLNLSDSHFPRLLLRAKRTEIKADGDELILPKKGNILAIQSFRNLKEIEKSYSLKSRPPRKLADF
ncbi:hypothetical protein Csa_002396 [Cucumis sativus]|nr:hypothetical protein Csa_002396 [Cucumis sativus]